MNLPNDGLRQRLLGIDRTEIHEDVRAAMQSVPRDLFVPDAYRNRAFEDHPLPIGYGQTISQPYIVALMTQEAHIQSGEKVLEIGTGSGYQSAVLSRMGAEVWSIEILPELAQSAAERLKRLGFLNVTVKQGDGWRGWKEHAPFDAIIVTAALANIPQSLFEQLADHGRLVAPLKSKHAGERLMVFEHRGEDLIVTDLGAVRFVPLTGMAEAESISQESLLDRLKGKIIPRQKSH